MSTQDCESLRGYVQGEQSGPLMNTDFPLPRYAPVYFTPERNDMIHIQLIQRQE
jgi:hypothetical protein